MLGAGFAGSVLGAILARAGLSVQIVDRQAHPRFAIGESTVPRTSLLLRTLAARFDVPELHHITSPRSVLRHVGTTCGVKKGFVFLHHDKGGSFSLVQTRVRKTENHYFRQDVDAYLFQAALTHGAVPRVGVGVTELELDREQPRLSLDDGSCIEARFVVDGTGFRSLIARRLDLREEPTRLQHRSRALFTHLLGVRPFEELLGEAQRAASIYPLSQGTTHHLFAGGWMWVIPFNNQQRSTSALTSIGLSLDPDAFPRRDEPVEDLKIILDRLPAVRDQLRGSTPVRQWTSTGRIQYSSRITVGQRFALLPHAAGFVDPLFSRGLASTVDILHPLALHLLARLQDRSPDVSADQVDTWQQDHLDRNDELVHGAFIAFRDRRLWEAWLDLFEFGAGRDKKRLDRVMGRWSRRRSPEVFDALLDVTGPGLMCPGDEEYRRIFEDAYATVGKVDSGELGAAEAARTISSAVAEASA